MEGELDEREYCSVFRSSVDARVWMCNVPLVDVADGLQASTSLRMIKAYVEELAERYMDFGQGRWERTSDDGWSYYPEGD